MQPIGFINSVLIGNIGAMVKTHKLHYISFSVISLGIEILGAFIDEKDYNKTDSEGRFQKAIMKLFPKKYHAYNKNDSTLFLYRSLRCGMTHQLRPGKGLALTTRDEAKVDGNKHLVKNKDGILILICEDLFDDFEKACQKVIHQINSGKLTHKKLRQTFLKIS